MQEGIKKRVGFIFSMDTCISCGACQLACKEANNLSLGEFFRRVEVVCLETKEAIAHYPYSGACNHCASPACEAACTAGAIRRLEDGTVFHDSGLCIGCGACLWNCPYGALSFSCSKGGTQKCNRCRERQSNGRQPACVDACPTQSLWLGDIEALQQEDDSSKPDLSFLPNPDVTKPSLCVMRIGGRPDA